jgi:copper(I)-binding protein
VTFKPSDCHVMLFGLTRDLEFGVNFEFTLQFAKAGHVTLTAEVSE